MGGLLLPLIIMLSDCSIRVSQSSDTSQPLFLGFHQVKVQQHVIIEARMTCSAGGLL